MRSSAHLCRGGLCSTLCVLKIGGEVKMHWLVLHFHYLGLKKPLIKFQQGTERKDELYSISQLQLFNHHTEWWRKWPRPERPADLRRWSISNRWWHRASHGGAHERHPWERRGPSCSHSHLQSRSNYSCKRLWYDTHKHQHQ